MLKKIVGSLLTSVSLLSMNVNPLLALPYDKIEPSVCKIVMLDKQLGCNQVILRATPSGGGNFQLCSYPYCLNLILTKAQLRNAANGRDFLVYSIELEKENSIISKMTTTTACGFGENGGLACAGTFLDDSAFLLYFY
jgi:hypothetical protein